MSTTKKYFWLKLRRDFFKRHDTKIIEAMENGKDYLLFYLKLLVESIDHEGNLRFSDTIPYNDKMLSVITDTNIDIVRSAVKVFSELGMMEQMDDGTLFMNHVNTMIGYETSDALRMRERREMSTQILIEQDKSEHCSNPFKNRSPELELELEKESEIEKEKNIIRPFTFEEFGKTISDNWKQLGIKPSFRFTTTMGLTTKEMEGFRVAYTRYTLEETCNAVANYAAILDSPEHTAFPSGYGLPGFLASGIEQYLDDADPWKRCEREKTADEKWNDRAKEIMDQEREREEREMERERERVAE